MLGSDIIVGQRAGLLEGQLDHPLGTRGEDHLVLGGLPPLADDGLHLIADLLEIDAQGLQDLGGDALAL